MAATAIAKQNNPRRRKFRTKHARLRFLAADEHTLRARGATFFDSRGVRRVSERCTGGNLSPFRAGEFAIFRFFFTVFETRVFSASICEIRFGRSRERNNRWVIFRKNSACGCVFDQTESRTRRREEKSVKCCRSLRAVTKRARYHNRGNGIRGETRPSEWAVAVFLFVSFACALHPPPELRNG